MLEHASLCVAPWTRATSPPAEWVRTITDAAGQPLGFVCFMGRAKRSWFSWLRGTRLDVYETDDASHLMTLIRPWGMFRIWDVYDAEERRVGSIYPPSLVDSEGERRGYLDLRDRERGTILDPNSQVAATFRRRASLGLDVTFTPDAGGNPFLRMLLLAGVLAQDPSPPR